VWVRLLSLRGTLQHGERLRPRGVALLLLRGVRLGVAHQLVLQQGMACCCCHWWGRTCWCC
jgi:hypothetical protein